MQHLWQDENVLFVPLGGSGEIGMNVNLFHHDGRWILVDLGINFPDESMPGIDVVLPDLKFIEKHCGKIEGLIVTHAHEDHIGAIPYLWHKLKCPIYGTPFTLALLRAKLRENIPDAKVKMVSLGYNAPVSIGSFEAELISLTHSIPDPAGLVLKAGGITIFHTGDWKFDASPVLGPQSDIDRLKALGDSGVDVMIGDSTNAMVEERTGSEEDALNGLIETIAGKEGRVAVTCFASNVARVDSLVRAALQTGRSPMLIGRALHRVVEAAMSCGYAQDWPDMLDEDDFDLVPRENILLICTGSQGESRSAMTRIAQGSHHKAKLEAGDTVIFSSREIPGNEIAIGKVHDSLIMRQIEVITDDDAPVHVSGHPGRPEMVEMYQSIRPRIAIPVHGTARHLRAHAALAKTCQVDQALIPENGTIIHLTGAGAKVIGAAETGLMTVKGGEIVPIDGTAMRARRQMLWNGNVSASIVLSLSGDLCLAPQVQQSGLAEGESANAYLAQASIKLEDMILDLRGDKRRDDKSIKEIAERTLRSMAKSMFGHRPMVQVHILRVDALSAV